MKKIRNEIFLRYEISTRTKTLLLHCNPVEGYLQRYKLITFVMETKYVFCFVLVKRHLSLALKHSCQVFSRWKAIYNGTPVEFIPGEGKPRRGIAMKMNEMFSVTPSGVETEKELKHSFQVVSRWKAVYNETPVEFIPEEGKTRQSIPL
ncbi:hypothetical protein T05_8702 [Trichinella murrelli]|uniref:Uncharacterized protein n=1 Tax=Trichinella murrelli TaxID=144512 RepID=A0A0V0T8H6_9BILA|nr:hypothetical protein T05_8702 [Trichinella murrelli]